MSTQAATASVRTANVITRNSPRRAVNHGDDSTTWISSVFRKTIWNSEGLPFSSRLTEHTPVRATLLPIGASHSPLPPRSAASKVT
jgi:hypothetical protein